ncbi:MAG: BamA/TamA family outer membrane protein [Cyclobacteriaceae bacterium]
MKEQNRIELAAQNMGYFYFDDRYLLFQADSTVGNRKVDLDLVFEPEVPTKSKRIYNVNQVNVFPNYSLRNDSLSTRGDTTQIKGYNYIDNTHAFRPEIITDVINLQHDSVYRKIDHEYTLSRLMSLNTFKFVNVKFTDDPNDSSALNANIYMTPLTKKSLRLQLQVVSKSNNFVGPGLEATFTNRNFLRGAELFQLRLSGAYESQISRQQSGALNAVELGADASLTVPRFITPIHIPYRSAKYLPQTQFRIGYNLQQRLQFFKLTSFNVGYGYTWRETTLKTHEFFPIDLSYVQSSNISAEFDQRLTENPTLANSFQDQFIPGLTYSFTFNSQLREDIEQKYFEQKLNKSNFYFHGTVGLAGNLLNLMQSVGNTGDRPYEVLGSPYSQYLRGEIDFRYYLQLDRHQKLATRLSMGTGYAFGNSTQLPYIKQFAIGGSNSIRSFPARSIGPGTFNIRDNATEAPIFIDQRADMKLEGNVEYRFDIVNSLKGAVFLDAGNIWMLKEDGRAGSAFDKDTFLNELAAGTGLGLRYDFSFFILRLDAAFPIRKPYLPIGERWVFDKIDFGSSQWRGENLILNIAIGYPF